MTTENKPSLKTKRVSYLKVSYREIERFICKVYGIPHYNIVATEEWSNDSQHRVRAEKGELDQWDLEKLDKVKSGREPSFSFRAVMTDLCNRDLIEPGDYLIDVSWWVW